MCRLGVNCSWCHAVLSVPVMIYSLRCAARALFSYTGQVFQIPEPHDGSTPLAWHWQHPRDAQGGYRGVNAAHARCESWLCHADLSVPVVLCSL